MVSIIKNVFMFFNYFNDLHILLAAFPFLWISRTEINVRRLFISLLYSFTFLFLIKGSLRIPHPQYTRTFAFPSGHCWMMLSTCYFVFKAILKEKQQYIFWTGFFSFIEAGLCISAGYHTFFDCAAGLFLSALFVWIINFINQKISSLKVNTLISVVFSMCVYVLITHLAPAYADKSFITIIIYIAFIVLMNFVPYIHIKTISRK